MSPQVVAVAEIGVVVQRILDLVLQRAQRAGAVDAEKYEVPEMTGKQPLHPQQGVHADADGDFLVKLGAVSA